jgi:hypothetical protein
MKRVHDRMAKVPHLIGRIQKVRHHNGNHPSGVGRSNTIVRVLKNKAARGIFRENFCTPEEWGWMRLASIVVTLSDHGIETRQDTCKS